MYTTISSLSTNHKFQYKIIRIKNKQNNNKKNKLDMKSKNFMYKITFIKTKLVLFKNYVNYQIIVFILEKSI